MKVFLFYVSAGQGHKKSAEALHEEFEKRGFLQTGSDLRLIDALNYTHFLFGRGYGFFYFSIVKYAPWFWGFLYQLTDRVVPNFILAPLRSWHNSIQAKRLESFLAQENPDLVICTHFFPAEVASRLKRENKITSKIVVVVTDFLVHRFWVNPGTDFYVGMMEETKEALVQLAVRTEKIKIFGIPVSSRFLSKIDDEAIRKNLSLEAGRFTILITSGSFGSGPIREAVLRMQALSGKIQVIVVCGINGKLYNELKYFRAPFPMAVLGFVDNMHELMGVADIIVSRSSGLTTCESLVRGVPMVIISQIPGQEAHNADLLRKHGAAFCVSDSNGFVNLIADLVQNQEKLDSVRSELKKMARPRAAHDIVDFSLSSL